MADSHPKRGRRGSSKRAGTNRKRSGMKFRASFRGSSNRALNKLREEIGQ